MAIHVPLQVSYVLNTEDVFLRRERRSKRSSEDILKAKSERMGNWLIHRFQTQFGHRPRAGVRI